MWFNLGLHILGKTFRMGCFFNSVRSIVRKEKYFSYTFAYKQPQNEHVICSFVIQMLCILCEAVYIHIFICVFSAADGIFTMQQHLPVPMSVIVSTVSTLVHSMFFCPLICFIHHSSYWLPQLCLHEQWQQAELYAWEEPSCIIHVTSTPCWPESKQFAVYISCTERPQKDVWKSLWCKIH